MARAAATGTVSRPRRRCHTAQPTEPARATAMSPPVLNQAPLLVVGAGLMGSGIAQVASQAGHRVMLFDTRPDAAA